MIELQMTKILWFIIIVLATIIDVIFGDPSFLYHPVQLIGSLVKILTKILNKGKNRKLKGFLLVIIVLLTVGTLTYGLQQLIIKLGFLCYFLFNLWFLSTALSEKSLFLAGKKVRKDLRNKNLEQARKDTAMLVSRKTENLNRIEIIQAVVESEAENSIDGIFAPLFFMFLGLFLSIFSHFLNPLVLVYIYKAINTMDSMIGYPYEPYKDFGYCAAKLDDFANFLPARIGSIFLLLAGGLMGYDIKYAIQIFESDRRNHLSPNAGHPEAAIAGLLELKLGGTHNYNGFVIEKPYIGKEKRLLNVNDITETIKIVIVAEELFLIISSLILIVVYFINFAIEMI